MELRKTLKFRSTNKIWNDLGLNRAFAIGYLTKIFKEFSGKFYTDWVHFYYQSGRERLELIESLPHEKQQILKNFKINALRQFDDMHKISNDEKNYNAYYGRTEKELEEIGVFMYEEICKLGNPLKIKKNECIDYVKIRVLDEIYMGIEREINTLKKLQSFFPQATFKEVPVEIDSKYAVDYEVYINQELVLAIQIKSSHYKSDNRDILKQTKDINYSKNKNYQERFGAKVINVYANQNGYIEDRKTFALIHSYLTKTNKKSFNRKDNVLSTK